MQLTGTLGFLGFGNMGGAIARGLVHAQTLPPDRIWIYDVDPLRVSEARACGLCVAATPVELAEQSSTLVLAVKPQTMGDALPAFRDAVRGDHLFVSIAAGISIAFIQDRLGGQTRVVRVMPNTPALVGAGAAGIALSGTCTAADEQTARMIFEAVGKVEIVTEDALHAVTALSGSGPAYFFYLVECLAEAAVSLGLSGEQARRLAVQTAYGAGRLLAESGEAPGVLRERVTSKGGTTAAALEAFRQREFPAVVKGAVEAAAARSRELGR